MFKVMKESPPIPETMSPDGKDFLRGCFIRNPAERPTASMLLEHKFLKVSLNFSDYVINLLTKFKELISFFRCKT